MHTARQRTSGHRPLRQLVGLVLVMVVTMAGATLGLSNSSSLAFGAIAPSSTSGSVTITPSGSRSCTLGVTCIDVSTGHAASFSVTGDSSASYTITLPSSTTLSDSNGNSMTVDTFKDSEGGSSTLDILGNDAFEVGATLHVGGGQSPGDYGGSFEVTVNYQ
jgi:hypothetical protein